MRFDYWSTYYRWKEGRLSPMEESYFHLLGRFAEGRAQERGTTILPPNLTPQERCDPNLWIAAGMTHLALTQQNSQ
jgi:hypothetical protein